MAYLNELFLLLYMINDYNKKLCKYVWVKNILAEEYGFSLLELTQEHYESIRYQDSVHGNVSSVGIGGGNSCNGGDGWDDEIDGKNYYLLNTYNGSGIVVNSLCLLITLYHHTILQGSILFSIL